MQTRLNTNFSTGAQKPSFGAIKLYGGADDTLTKVLKMEDWKTFQAIAENQKANEYVDMILFGGTNSKKLTGRLVPKEMNMFTKEKDYSQGFFESAINFIEKLSKKANDYAKKVAKTSEVNPDEILKSLSEQ